MGQPATQSKKSVDPGDVGNVSNDVVKYRYELHSIRYSSQ